MRYGKAYRVAWASLDAAVLARDHFARSVDLGNGSKLSRDDAETLCSLSQEIDRWQERIRIIQGRPLPGTANAKTRAKVKERVSLERRPAAPMAPRSAAQPIPPAEPGADGHRTPAGLLAPDSAPLLDGDSES